jgi:undecaprenyl phosphate-alpha-L-ara4FN deformylase
MRLGLKIDVDTFRGTREGVLPLARFLADRNLRGSFFFSVGPDNMGRHLWRLFKPRFLAKMLRSGGVSLYGWDVILRGIPFPGPVIGRRLAPVIQETAKLGHEIGVHAWDHHAWQTRMEPGGRAFMESEIRQAGDLLAEVAGQWPTCSAAAGWKCNEDCLRVKQLFPFHYNSDCRGHSIFRPTVEGTVSPQPQIPTTLPTYDELIGRNGITAGNYNEHLLTLLKPGHLNVLTVHAEAEGRVCHVMFRGFVTSVCEQGWEILPLGRLLPDSARIPPGTMERREIPGREGWVAVQAASQGTPPRRPA